MKTLLSLAAFAAALASGGCVTAAAAGIGVVLTQDFVERANSVYLEEDADVVWQASKDTLANLSRDPIETDDELRAASAVWGGATVALHVEALDLADTKLSVGASKFGLYDNDVAQDVIRRIRRRLER